METDVYGLAWKILAERIAATRKQSISKADLIQWQLKALEGAIDRAALEKVYAKMEEQRGQQKETD